MNDRLHAAVTAPLFRGLAHTPVQHFTLHLFAAVLRIAGLAAERCSGVDAVVARFPFLCSYLDEIAGLGLDGVAFAEAQARWAQALADWEAESPLRLPLAALRDAAGLEPDDLVVLVAAGLPDEDPRLASVLAAVSGSDGTSALTAPLATMLWPPAGGVDVRAALARFEALGLLVRSAETLAWRVQPELWPLLRGALPGAAFAWLQHRSADDAPALETLLLPAGVQQAVRAATAALAGGEADTLAIRGPRHNGRHTLAAAVAREGGRGTLRVDGPIAPDDPRWRHAGVVAALCNAVIVVAGDPGPSESFVLPAVPARLAPLIAVLGVAGALAGPRGDACLSLALPMPPRALREALWREQAGVDRDDAAQVGALAHRRLTTGAIVRAARMAFSAAPGRPVDLAALRQALRGGECAGLATLARRIEVAGEPPPLALPAQTADDLRLLVARCRHRESLGQAAGAALWGLGCGVRALFKGPTGTGKTLAARHLAAHLGMELYRVDLAAVVNKYIGETEKNLERVFAEAEAHDVILLLDEGDALLTQRTGVGNANDRYANLETNYLLQRLESYEGILIVTTNAAERIDGAFQRRLDIVIDFPAPEAAERWALWQMHLPPLHAVDPARLQTVAQRCVLAGGQIRNVVLHATLLAVEAGCAVDAGHVEAALEREYRKQGSASPLRAAGR